MNKVFVTSDNWFNRVLTDSPDVNVQDLNKVMIAGWNKYTDNNDDVYVLGGFGITDLYSIVCRLKGRIHFLNNCYNEEQKELMSELKSAVEKSSDETLKDRIIFEDKQILVLNDLDAVLSYYPLEEWPGKETGTFCFYGMKSKSDLHNHGISCVSGKWNNELVDIEIIKKNLSIFAKKL